MKRLNVLISGFDPYDGVSVNPALEVPRRLAEQGIEGPDGEVADVGTVTLPVSFANAWPALLTAIEATGPDIVIATGLKRTARGIMLERCATNLMDAEHPDADNAVPRRLPIVPEGPAAYWTRLPLRAILRGFMHDDIPASLSSDAGTFVCNSLFYHLLDWSAGRQDVLAGFVSLPQVVASAHSEHGLTLDQQTAAVRDVVLAAMRYHRRPSSADILLS